MPDQRIDVITYSGYRGEETPRSILIHHDKIDVVAILNRWIEEGIEDRVRKRFFEIKGSDGKIHRIYYDEKETEWFKRTKASFTREPQPKRSMNWVTPAD